MSKVVVIGGGASGMIASIKASKNNEVVEYALSRTLSPLLVSQYQLKLPDKNILQKKLQELIYLPGIGENIFENEE